MLSPHHGIICRPRCPVVQSVPRSVPASRTAASAEMARRRLRLVAGGRHSRRPGRRGRAIDRRRRAARAPPPTWVRPAGRASGITSGRTNGCCPRQQRPRRRRRASLLDNVDEISASVAESSTSAASITCAAVWTSRNLATTITTACCQLRTMST